jgi:anti-anti-sigma factor
MDPPKIDDELDNARNQSPIWSITAACGFCVVQARNLRLRRDRLVPTHVCPYNFRTMSESLVVARMGPVFSRGVLCLRGPMTAENLSPFQNAIRNESGPVVILDLTEVPYMDSAGLGSLVSAYITCHKSGCQVVLAGTNDRLLKLFEISRVESLFLMFPTLDDAIGAFAAPTRA